MKSYIQGMLTGGAIVSSLIILLGSQDKEGKNIQRVDKVKKVFIDSPENREALKDLGMDPDAGVGRYQIALSEANVIRMLDTRTADLYYWHNTKDSWQFMGEFK